jgi:hypothetical protein
MRIVKPAVRLFRPRKRIRGQQDPPGVRQINPQGQLPRRMAGHMQHGDMRADVGILMHRAPFGLRPFHWLIPGPVQRARQGTLLGPDDDRAMREMPKAADMVDMAVRQDQQVNIAGVQLQQRKLRKDQVLRPEFCQMAKRRKPLGLAGCDGIGRIGIGKSGIDQDPLAPVSGDQKSRDADDTLIAHGEGAKVQDMQAGGAALQDHAARVRESWLGR